MKRILITLALFLVVVGIMAVPAMAAKPANNCVTYRMEYFYTPRVIYLAGQPLKVGYDPYGYNYQAHMFSGSYVNAYLNAYGFPPYEGDDDPISIPIISERRLRALHRLPPEKQGDFINILLFVQGK
jgi:hypothetical protein